MIVSDVRVRATSYVTDRYHIGSKARHGCKVVFNHSSSVVLVLYHSRYVLVVLGSGYLSVALFPTDCFASKIRFNKIISL